MGCEIAEGFRLNFLHSNIILRSSDLSTRSERGHHAYLKAKISRRAGDLVDDHATVGEPVTLTIGGVTQNRYVYTAESLTLHSDEAWLTLYDARTVLDAGVLSKTYNETTLAEVVEFIFENRDDRWGVLDTYRIVDEAVAERSTQNFKEQINEFFYGDDYDTSNGDFLRLYEDANEFIYGFVASILPVEKDMGGFDFEDVTPGQALTAVEAEFGVEAWVDADGVLWIGEPTAKPTNHHIVPPDVDQSPYAIKDYNITEGAVQFTRVKYDGTTSMQSAGASILDVHDLYPIAEAWSTDDDGAVFAPDEKVRLKTPAAVERRARLELLRLIADDRNGNVVFNGLASGNQDELATMTVGDLLLVAPEIENWCGKNHAGGLFVVEEVQHKVNTREGWSVVAEVGQLPIGGIQSDSFWYQPGSGERYEDLEAYRNDN